MNAAIKNLITSSADLVTTHEQTRAGFISFALEKSNRSIPFVAEARAFKVLAAQAKTPDDLLLIEEIRSPLLTASGLSDKALKYFTEADKDEAIKKLVDNFLKPAGENFIEEAVYRFLLVRGDTLGGAMRNVAGVLAQKKLVRAIIASLSIHKIGFAWFDGTKWTPGDYKSLIEDRLKAFSWKRDGKNRVLAFNLTIQTVKNNIDICLFDATENSFANGAIAKNCDKSAIMFGELKGGIDPAGADEHWKTGNTALERIRKAFRAANRTDIKTAFIAAAIERKMAKEIWQQLSKNVLDFAINLNFEKQLVSFCEWVIGL